MTGWLLFIGLALVVLGLLWRFARFDAGALQFLGAALLLALAGYAWQGNPGLAGRPKAPPARIEVPESAFAETRRDVLGQFDRAGTWLTMAENYQRRGDTRGGVDIIRSGLRNGGRDPDLWVGLGNALVLHAGGLMTPASQLAFARAEQIAPGHPGPRFFYGLALAQGGRIDEAEQVWRQLLATLPEDVSWRGLVEERVRMIEQARAAGRLPTPPQTQPQP
jgi:cytochrome c-type biogenesis protein CcmH/NrfG